VDKNPEMTDSPDILTACDLHKYYGKGLSRTHAMRGVSLSVRRGEFLAVMGPSGCGKSTLLHVLGLITPPDQGSLTVNGQVVYEQPETAEDNPDLYSDRPTSESALTLIRRRQIGFVFQRFNLLGVLNAFDNVAISLRVRGLEANGRIEELFERLHITHVMRRKPGQMSIGEQQRVAIVRAMAHRPALLLADEPTGNLDSANSRELLDTFREMNRQERQTIIMITHSAEASSCADRILQMKDGRILDHAQ
jgi:putative ABC transport system ATP-binding protein